MTIHHSLHIALFLAVTGCSTAPPSTPDQRERVSDELVQQLGHPFGVVLFVNPLTCMMDARDASRINRLAQIPGMEVQVLFFGVIKGDSSTLLKSRKDLGLSTDVDVAEAGPLSDDVRKVLGHSGPIGVIVRENQIRAIVAGEELPRTIRLLESAFTRLRQSSE